MKPRIRWQISTDETHESGDDTKSVSLACEFTTLCWLTQEKEKWLIPTQITKGGKDNPTDEQSFKRKCQWKNGRDEPNINIQQAHWQSGDVGLRPQTHGWCKGEKKKEEDERRGAHEHRIRPGLAKMLTVLYKMAHWERERRRVIG